MNNRYICRGKRKDNGEWVEGYLIQGNRTYIVTIEAINYMVVSTSCIASIELAEVIPETVGQCTSLKDKNRKWIFEGDILRDKESEFIGSVKFNDVLASFVVVINDTTQTFYHYSWLNKGDVTRDKILKNTEVIGNIHDNRELLEVEI